MIFIGYIGVISFYTHVHIVNGVTIVHSHPFQKNVPGKPFHSHSQTGFQLIHSLTSFSLTADAVPHFSWGCFPDFIESPVPVVLTGFLHVTTGVLSLRAPPFPI